MNGRNSHVKSYRAGCRIVSSAKTNARVQRYGVVPRCRPLLRIEWHDAHGGSAWRKPAAVSREPLNNVQVGYYIGRSAGAITLAAGHSDNGDVGDVTTIPVCCVRAVKYLGERWQV